MEKNGEGQSTVTKLFTGLYPEYEGRSYTDGKELRICGLSEIKAIFPAVYQGFASYVVSVCDNDLLGDVPNICLQKN
ncbi:MAG: hypothetical protein HFH05_07945 [Lachnospiraceae bacterium]|nr:hypothetical protein [Lachnospiraceae bacterium]